MARIESTPGPRISLSASIGRGRSLGSSVAFSRGLRSLQSGTDAVSDALLNGLVQHQQRNNQRKVYENQVRFKSVRTDLLFGQNGLTLRQGGSAEGVAEEGTRELNRRAEEILQNAPNSAVRRVLEQELGAEIADTRDYLARHEASELEQGRRASANTLLAQRGRELVMFEQDKLYPGEHAEDRAKFAETLSGVQEWMAAVDPDQSDEAVTALSRQWMADRAAESVFALMDRGGTGNLRQAREIQAFYEGTGLWDAEKRKLVQNRVRDEIAFTDMDNIVASIGGELGAGASELEMRRAAESQFKSRFQQQFGEAPDNDMVESLRRKVSDYNARLDDQLKEKRNRVRRDALTEVNRTMLSSRGDHEAVLTTINGNLERAFRSKDADLQESLLKMRENFLEGGSLHPENRTALGSQLLIEGSAGKTQEQILAAMSEMPDDQWRAWAEDGIEMLQSKQGGAGANAELSTTSHVEKRRVIERQARVVGRFSALSDSVMAERVHALTVLDQRFVQTNHRKPNPDELWDMANALDFSLDDPGFDEGGFTGTVRDFLLAAPGENRQLSVNDKADLDLLTTALSIANADPQVRDALNREIGLAPRAAAALTPQALADHPEAVRVILEYGLASGVRFGVTGEFGRVGRTGRELLSNARELQ